MESSCDGEVVGWTRPSEKTGRLIKFNMSGEVPSVVPYISCYLCKAPSGDIIQVEMIF